MHARRLGADAQPHALPESRRRHAARSPTCERRSARQRSPLPNGSPRPSSRPSQWSFLLQGVGEAAYKPPPRPDSLHRRVAAPRQGETVKNGRRNTMDRSHRGLDPSSRKKVPCSNVHTTPSGCLGRAGTRTRRASCRAGGTCLRRSNRRRDLEHRDLEAGARGRRSGGRRAVRRLASCARDPTY